MKKKQMLTTVLAAAAVALLAVVIVLACMLYAQSRKDQSDFPAHGEYYAQKCDSFSVQNANLAEGQIVFIGDSITDLYILDDHYADLPLAVYNRGIGGDTTDGVLDRLQVSVFDIKPSKVVLMIGTNDVNGGVDSDRILERYEQIIRRIYEALPQVELYCMSIIPQNAQLATYSTIDVAASTEKILELNPGIKALAETNGATYLDLFSLLADDNDRLITAYSDDGLHLNVAGLSVWTDLLKPHLLAG